MQSKLTRLSITILLACLSIYSIVWINSQIMSAWFGKDGPANLGSIEVSYVSMARFLIDFGSPISGSSWNPLWYFGFPAHLFYTPLLPFLEAFLHKNFTMTFWESYRFLTGIAYIGAPISVFLLGWQLSKRVLGGIIAGVLFSIGPTIFYFILPSIQDSYWGEVAADRYSLEFWDPRRFTILVRWGEGPHLFSLLFVPLVGVFFARLLEKPRFLYFFITSLFLGLAALTQAIGLFSSVLLIASMAFVHFAQSEKDKYKGFLLGVGTGLMSLGLISFWYNISFISDFFAEGGSTTAMLYSIFPWGWVGGLFILAILYFICKKIIKSFGIATSLVWFSILFTVVATYYFSAPHAESYRRIELLPQALRYNVEVDLSLSVFIGVLISLLVGAIISKLKLLKALLLVEVLIGISILFLTYWYIQPFIETAQKATGTRVDLTKTREFEIAKWLTEHTDEKKAERVFLPGNYGFYLNYFTNVSQHRGGLFQAATHFWPEHMHYQMTNGKNADIAKAWLVAANTKYAVVTTAGSSELYKELKNLDRFQSLPVALEEKGDIIYKIPLRKPSLAKPISISMMQNLKAPVKADDKEPLLAYADWVEDSSTNQTSFTVVNNDRYIIEGDIREGEGILVQMTSDSGWKALNTLQNGKSIGIGKDPMGFLVLYPPAGKVDIALVHRESPAIWLGYIISIVSVLLMVVVYIRSMSKHISHKESLKAKQAME